MKQSKMEGTKMERRQMSADGRMDGDGRRVVPWSEKTRTGDG